MKSLIAIILTLSMFSNIASASLVICDWKKVQNNSDGTFTYSKELHLCVGHLVYNQTADNQQIEDLTEAVAELNFALEKSDEQAKIWQASSTDMNIKINQIKSQEKSNNWIYFGLGALTIVAAGYAARQAYGH